MNLTQLINKSKKQTMICHLFQIFIRNIRIMMVVVFVISVINCGMSQTDLPKYENTIYVSGMLIGPGIAGSYERSIYFTESNDHLSLRVGAYHHNIYPGVKLFIPRRATSPIVGILYNVGGTTSFLRYGVNYTYNDVYHVLIPEMGFKYQDPIGFMINVNYAPVALKSKIRGEDNDLILLGFSLSLGWSF